MDRTSAISGAGAEPTKSRVFISYSRKDSTFAGKLRVALISAGFEAYLDKEDILPGEPWRDRLEQLIRGADAVVFIISPDFIASEHCLWEVERTLELKKALVPLLWRAVPDRAVPERLAAHNYVFFDAYERSGMADEAIFRTAMARLSIALTVAEALWVREHTKWVARAAEWDKAEPARPEGKLLPTGDLAAAEAWARLRPAQAPEIPLVLADYLRESLEKHERDSIRRRRIIGRAFVKPAEEALAKGRHEQALKLAAAGAVLSEDLHCELVPELWSHAARAMLKKRSLAVLKGGLRTFSPDGRSIMTASSDGNGRVWDAETGKQIAALEGHTKEVNGVAFSPDGQRIVTASADASARLWDAATGKEITVLEGHGRSVRRAAFSPNGQWIVTACDATARIWDVVTGMQVALFRGSSAVFSPNSQLIATTPINPIGLRMPIPPPSERASHFDNCVRLWDRATGKQIFAFEGQTGYIHSAAFSSDGRRIVTADGRSARLWDTITGQRIAAFEGRPVLSPNGQRIATFGSTASLWDVETGERAIALEGYPGQVVKAVFSPDSCRIVAASYNRTALLWEAETGQQTAVLEGHAATVRSAAFSPDSRRIVTASDDHTARIWDTSTGNQIAVLAEHTETVSSAAFSPDGRRVLTKSYGTNYLWDAATGMEIAPLQGHAGSVWSAAFNPSGRRVVTASLDRTARLWDAATGKQIAAFEGHTDLVHSAAFNPDGRRIVTASSDATARIWDAATGEQCAVLEGHTGDRPTHDPAMDEELRSLETITFRTMEAYHTYGVLNAAFSPDGERIVTASADTTARLWDAATGQQIVVLEGHAGPIESARFSTDGSLILTASWDKSARLWDAATGKQTTTLEGHAHRVVSAAFSPDSQRIVTASYDNTARVWDAETGQQIAVLQGHTSTVWSAAFSLDGRRILTASRDGTARIWDAETAKQIATLEGYADSLSAALSQDGRRILTTPNDHTARIWDVSRTVTITRDPAFALTAALGCGIGWRTNEERTDLLMQDAPDDLYVEARRQLLDPEKYSPEEIAWRERQLEETICELRAPLHSNCYLSPSQFAERFGLKPPAAQAMGTTETAEGSATAQAETQQTPNRAKDARFSAEPAAARYDQSFGSVAQPMLYHRRSWVLWLLLTWAIAATAVAAFPALPTFWW